MSCATKCKCFHIPSDHVLRAIQILFQPLFLLVALSNSHCTQNRHDPASLDRFPRDLHSAFVLHLTMGKASDDNYRPNPDSEANSARYPPQTTTICHTALLEDSLPPTGAVPSSSIRVGDLVLLEKNQRVPANLCSARTNWMARQVGS
ncbi:hypothetical protein BC827DRAFT_239019 [Russula dissimulans]|nr:hypothetical protein BC827DRAFT_239019 [Russula dissimulans]